MGQVGRPVGRRWRKDDCVGRVARPFAAVVTRGKVSHGLVGRRDPSPPLAHVETAGVVEGIFTDDDGVPYPGRNGRADARPSHTTNFSYVAFVGRVPGCSAGGFFVFGICFLTADASEMSGVPCPGSRMSRQVGRRNVRPWNQANRSLVVANRRGPGRRLRRVRFSGTAPGGRPGSGGFPAAGT